MTRNAMMLLGLLTLAACGAAGAPSAPEPMAAKPGLTVTGEAQVGVVVNPAMVEGQ